MAEFVQQPSFAAGELAPDLYGRVDLEHYRIGLRTCRNFWVSYHGGVVNRAGTRFIQAVGDESRAVRVVRFQFSTEQTYALELGHQYLRVFRNGAPVLDGGGATVEIATPYAADDLFELKLTQSADVVTITHPGYAPRELSRTAHDSWSLDVIDFGISATTPTGLTANRVNMSETDVTLTYVVSALDSLDGNESAASDPVEVTIAQSAWDEGANGNYRVDLRWDPVEGAGAYYVYRKTNSGSYGQLGVGLGGNESYTDEDARGGTGTNTPQSTSDPGAPDTPTGLAATMIHGGEVVRYAVTAIDEAEQESVPSDPVELVVDRAWPNDGRVELIWDKVDGALRYRVYKDILGYWGFIGEAAQDPFPRFVDDNIRPSTDDAPPEDRDPFAAAGEYPACATYFQQRILYAGADDAPQTVQGSRTGDYRNFARATPPAADDALEFTIAAREVNRIRNLVPLGDLIAFTSGGEWVVQAAGGEALTPANVQVAAQSYRGSEPIAPLVIGDTALYVQKGGRRVRDLGYRFDRDRYTGADLTVRSAHLFRDRRIVDWAYAQEPDSIVWVVTDDGALLSFTYLPEQQVWAWARHDTGGGDAVESVETVEEDGVDAVYLVVRRTVDGSTRRYLERLEPREFETALAWFFVDSGLSYDGRNTGDTTVTISGGSSWEYYEEMTATRSAGAWAADIAGRVLVVTVDAETVRFTVTSRDSDTELTVRAERDVPEAVRATATTDWSVAVAAVAGLDHLEGRTVSILGDAHVFPQQTVSGGEVALTRACSVIHAGLPITAEIETLDLAFSAEQRTARPARKLTGRCWVSVRETRGIRVGRDRDDLKPVKQRDTEGWGEAIEAETGLLEAAFPTRWDRAGRLVVQQTDPLPAEIQGVIPEVEFGR